MPGVSPIGQLSFYLACPGLGSAQPSRQDHQPTPPPATGLLPKRCTTAALCRSEPSRDAIPLEIAVAATDCSDNLNFQ